MSEGRLFQIFITRSVKQSGPEAHAFVECGVRVNALNGNADRTGARQRTEVIERGVPRSQESELEVLRLLRPRCHDDHRYDDQR